MHRPGLHTCLWISLAALVVLLVAFFIAAALAWLLEGMGDQLGGQVLRGVALGLAGLMLVDLFVLVVLQALVILEDRTRPPD